MLEKIYRSGDSMKPTSIRFDDETKTLLDQMCMHYALDVSKCLRQLIHLGAEYHILEPNFQELIIKETLETFKEKEKIRLRSNILLGEQREASKERDRQHTGKLRLLGYYLSTLTESERKQFFDEQLNLKRSIEGDNIQRLPAILPQSQAKDGRNIEVYINCKRVLVKELLPDGETPKLEYNQDRIVKCSEGWHIHGTDCSTCEKRFNCPLLIDERLQRYTSKF